MTQAMEGVYTLEKLQLLSLFNYLLKCWINFRLSFEVKLLLKCSCRANSFNWQSTDRKLLKAVNSAHTRLTPWPLNPLTRLSVYPHTPAPTHTTLMQRFMLCQT